MSIKKRNIPIIDDRQKNKKEIKEMIDKMMSTNEDGTKENKKATA